MTETKNNLPGYLREMAENWKELKKGAKGEIEQGVDFLVDPVAFARSFEVVLEELAALAKKDPEAAAGLYETRRKSGQVVCQNKKDEIKRDNLCLAKKWGVNLSGEK